ncbi:MAG: hypothetical protein Q8N60_01640, partial [Candidatus Diapherotrites archaeon]|nr:hypothetical protein [Candidatus Diapherotrites archaeon]
MNLRKNLFGLPCLNEQGQESSGFRLLVEAVMVVFILVIIFAVISKLDEVTQRASEKRLFEGFSKAVDSPDGAVIFEKDLVLREGSVYSRTAFAQAATSIEPDSISIQASNSSAFLLINGDAAVEIRSTVSTNVYYQCITKYEA